MEQPITEVEEILGLAEMGRHRIEAFHAQLLRLLSMPADHNWSAEPIIEEDRQGLVLLTRLYRSGCLMLWTQSIAKVAEVGDEGRRQAAEDAWGRFMSHADPVALDGVFQQMIDMILPDHSSYPGFWEVMSEVGGRLLMLAAQCDISLYEASGHAAADLDGDQSADDGTATGFLSSFAYLAANKAPEAGDPRVHQTAALHLSSRIAATVSLFTRQNRDEDEPYTEGVGRYTTDKDDPSNVYFGLVQPTSDSSDMMSSILVFRQAIDKGSIGIARGAGITPIVCSLPLMGYWDRVLEDEDS